MYESRDSDFIENSKNKSHLLSMFHKIIKSKFV